MLDLKALSKQANTGRFPTVEELRALPILYVLERAGVAHEEGDGTYVAKSPFRYDEHPSFDIFGEHLERWGDWAEGSNGDVLDLLQRFAPNLPFVGVKDWAARLLRECTDSGWSGPRTGGVRKVFDLEKARAYVNNVLTGFDAMEPLGDFLRRRKDYLADIEPLFLVDEFHIGWDGERLVIPYVAQSGSLRWYKTRTLEGPVRAASGGGYDTIFYGEDRDHDDSRTVVLCEGESDVWSGTHAANQDRYVFLGLPTGAGTAPEMIAPRLAGRRIILAFDGDTAGRAATRTWMRHLWRNADGAHDLMIPWGYDLAMWDPNILDSALEGVPLT